MTRTIIGLIILLIAEISYSQLPIPLAIEKYWEGSRRFTPIENVHLFDLAEIATRKIDTAYIIRHSASWDPGFPNDCSYNDTLYLYCFNSKGDIIQRTQFQGSYSTTFRYDSTGQKLWLTTGRKGVALKTTVNLLNPPNTTKWKRVILREKLGSDSLLTEIVFQRFKTGFDTCYVIISITNDKGQILERSSHSNKKCEMAIDDDTNELTYRFKYGYDDRGRVTYFLSYDYLGYPSIYKKISYPAFGKIIEAYNAQTDILINKDVQLISIKEGVITFSMNTGQITFTPLEKNSKLYKLKTVVSGGEFPYIEYYEVSYR